MTAKSDLDPASGRIALTREDVALLADGTGNIPDGTATRLRELVRCRDLELIARTWRWIGKQVEDLRRLAEDAGVELLADGLYVFRCLERLRSGSWRSPTEVLDPRLDVPYQELISMAGAHSDRAEGAEKAELQGLIERLASALSEQIRGEELLELMALPTPRKPR